MLALNGFREHVRTALFVLSADVSNSKSEFCGKGLLFLEQVTYRVHTVPKLHTSRYECTRITFTGIRKVSIVTYIHVKVSLVPVTRYWLQQI